MADLRGVIAGLIRRPAFWRADPPLPIVLVTGEHAFKALTELTEPFEDNVPYASVEEGAHANVSELVEALAGDLKLGKPVGGSFLPAPRFPFVQFVLWAKKQPWKGGYGELKKRLRRRNRGSDHNVRTTADFLTRAATTWVPLGTFAVWWVGGASDLVGIIPWLLGGTVAVIGTAAMGVLSIRGSLFTGWFRKQPYLQRDPFERLPDYARRLAKASGDPDIELLLVHALCGDMRTAYKKWVIPWPSWGRGLYSLVLLEIKNPSGVNADFLHLLEKTTEETGLLPPMIVLASVPDDFTTATSAKPLEFSDLDVAVKKWQELAKRRLPRLRLDLRSSGPPSDQLAQTYTPRLVRSRLRALGYWGAVLLLVTAPLAWVFWAQQDRDAHCGGLAWVERIEGECVGVVNAAEATPDDLFDGEVKNLIRKIDANNAYATSSGRYVSVVLFGEFSIKKAAADDTRLASAMSELAAVEEYQRTVSSTPRLRVLIANAGDNFRQGRRTAELITGLAEADRHVMGVVGFPRSVEGVRQAVDVLHAAKIPMVASTATADRLGYLDDTGNPSPYYFHVGPTNFREASLAARFAGRLGLRLKSAVIVQDGSPSDDYTNNLAADLETTLVQQGVDVKDRLSYTVNAGGISAAAVKACELKPDVLIYAGRAPEFRDFLVAIEGKACGTGVLKVIAGDDVVKVVVDHGAEIANMKQVEVYHLALANRALWSAGSAKPTAFVGRLLQGAHTKAADENLILTYDAISVVYQAANAAYLAASTDQGLPSRGDILYRLSRTSGSSSWEGSGGVIDFAPSERHGPVNKAVAIMKVEKTTWGYAKPVVRCGMLDTNEPPPKDAICDRLPDAAPK
ncbi:type 1 periplasmic-binding domain-containing protein [Nonomuraea turcica]|uniref:hypothetical protein n=1 Tax=Nonomuraea sp. G32 TaxID=3067274 RepID=UPI00273B277D|nr:hypothetical protein [Nonomuraea sp. G32]MDP4507922.1 hypothetical protein [Nonomuraea sp. G32]